MNGINNKPFFLAALLLCLGFMPKQVKKKVIFFGDSITEAGVKPGGYIRILDTLVRQTRSAAPELLGAGISGNKVYDLYLRLGDDVLAKKPDVVVIWIGVNDVWHKRLTGTGTDPDRFERFYTAIIRKLKEANSAVVLCTPAVVGEQKGYANELDGDLNKYSALIRKIAADNRCPLIDLRQIFQEHIQANNPANKDRGILTTDGVHLNAAGNRLVAERMNEALKTFY